MSRRLLLAMMTLWVPCRGVPAHAAAPFRPITPSMADKIVTLTGQDLTVAPVE